MDRSWISAPKLTEAHKRGVEEFLKFASQNALEDGKMACPCSRCRNFEILSRGTVRKHLLKLGFDRDYTRWVCHGEIYLTSGSSELTKEDEGNVDRGNDPKPTVGTGDSSGLQDIDKQDLGSDEKEISVAEELQSCGLKLQEFKFSEQQPYQNPDDQKLLLFSFCLYKLRRKFGCDRQSFDELINEMVASFVMFDRLPICFNSVCKAFSSDDSTLSNTERGNCRTVEGKKRVLTETGQRCYVCNQVLKSDACTSKASKRGKNRKPTSKK